MTRCVTNWVGMHLRQVREEADSSIHWHDPCDFAGSAGPHALRSSQLNAPLRGSASDEHEVHRVDSTRPWRLRVVIDSRPYCRLCGTCYPSARWRNAAIWPRVTTLLGQYWSLVGGFYPLVTPAVQSLSMSFSKIESSSSINRFPPPSIETGVRFEAGGSCLPLRAF